MLTRAYPSWVPVAAGAVSNAMQHRLKSLIMYQYETPVLIHLLKLAQLAFFVAQPSAGLRLNSLHSGHSRRAKSRTLLILRIVISSGTVRAPSAQRCASYGLEWLYDNV